MTEITDLVLALNTAGSNQRWPAAKKWITEQYGDHQYFSLVVEHTDEVLEPRPPEFQERWALIAFTVNYPDYQQTFFYITFKDSNDELVFRLKWL